MNVVEGLTPSPFKREKKKIYRSDLHRMRNQITLSTFIFILN